MLHQGHPELQHGVLRVGQQHHEGGNIVLGSQMQYRGAKERIPVRQTMQGLDFHGEFGYVALFG